MHSTVKHAGLTCLLLLLALLSFVASNAPAQGQNESPVFKTYRRPPDVPHVEESDALNQIWLAFLALRKANAGDILAQQEIAIRYLYGKGVERDTVKAAYWMQKAAEQNLPPAMFNVAIMAYHGWGMPWNPFLSYTYLLSCADKEMPEAEYLVAIMLTEDLAVPRDWVIGLDWMSKAAKAGYAPAKEALPEFKEKAAEAEAVKKGKPSSTPASTAANLPSTAAPVFLDFSGDSTQGKGKSIGEIVRNAGEDLREALGMSQKLDSTKMNVDSAALGHLYRAADAGSPEALTVLGRCYEKGLDVKQDSVKAAAYYVRAIRLDAPKATTLLWPMLQEKSFMAQLKTRSTRGDPDADYVWATLAALGLENSITPAEAQQMLRKAVEKKSIPAIIEMGLWQYGGNWGERDKNKATQLWKQAAGLGSREARIRLAVTELMEKESRREDSTVVAQLRQAVPEGSVLAEVGLGYCYEQGIGVAKNFAEAAHWYRAGAVRGSQDAYRALRRMYDAIRPTEKEFQLAD